MSIKVTYKGVDIIDADSVNKKLTTAGKYLEDDITIVGAGAPPVQTKTATPSTTAFWVYPDSGKLLSGVYVQAVQDVLSRFGYSKYKVIEKDGVSSSGSSGNEHRIYLSYSEQPSFDVLAMIAFHKSSETSTLSLLTVAGGMAIMPNSGAYSPYGQATAEKYTTSIDASLSYYNGHKWGSQDYISASCSAYNICFSGDYIFILFGN